jgi:hypothetical protein
LKAFWRYIRHRIYQKVLHQKPAKRKTNKLRCLLKRALVNVVFC